MALPGASETKFDLTAGLPAVLIDQFARNFRELWHEAPFPFVGLGTLPKAIETEPTKTRDEGEEMRPRVPPQGFVAPLPGRRPRRRRAGTPAWPGLAPSAAKALSVQIFRKKICIERKQKNA